MKILFISMHSVHATRWIENLKDTSFQLFWYDVTNKGRLQTIGSVTQFTELQKRKRAHIKGEYFLSKKLPKLYGMIRSLLEVTENEALESIIAEIKPDIVHSFEMQSCSYPILKTMQKFPQIKWVYSCWGSDLFYFKDFKKHEKKIAGVLKRVNYLHTDCQRDFDLAKMLGFTGEHIGVIPGGGGYKLAEIEVHKKPVDERNIILVKGYQHVFGKALNIIKALELIKNEIKEYEIIVFGAHKEVIEYVNTKKLNIKVYNRHELSQDELLELMGKSLLYVGNNISDGIPNTLLEAIVMGVFPIQSNPGNATAEIIHHGENGFLIQNPEDVNEILQLILQAIRDKKRLLKAQMLNEEIAQARLDYYVNQEKVIALYRDILKGSSQCE